MVMEATPSPQTVGREFVRQYYTLLNEAPSYLHRFYNHHSSFVHGGLDSHEEVEPVIGQKQIHQKIQQLNFRDCHAKIRQMDSQATLGDGVVVQVTGELSNSGQPMRRFTQTFVLAPQSPKKYYVHNDIFRYQDEIFNDEEPEQDSGRSEAEEDVEPDHVAPVESHPAVQQMAYFNPQMTSTPPTVNGQAHPDEVSVVAPQQPSPTIPMVQPMPGPPATAPAAPVPASMIPAQPAPIPKVPPMAVQVVPPPPGVVAMVPAAPLGATPITALPTSVPLPVAAVPMVSQEKGEEVVVGGEEERVAGEEEVEEEEEEVEEEEDEEETEEKAGDENLEEAQPESTSNEPKTYATLVKSGGLGGFASSAGSMPGAPSKPPTSPPLMNRGENKDVNDGQMSGQSPSNIMGGGGGGMNTPQPQRLSRGSRGGSGGGAIRGVTRDRGPGRGVSEDSVNSPQTGSSSWLGSGSGNWNMGGDGDRRRMGNSMHQYSDSQQLFMGNLPHHAGENDLRELFGKFGTILDLRIHSKPNTKGPGGKCVPNYGFIVFKDPASVQDVLSRKPIYFPGEGGQKLNVEEKKTRPRQEGGGSQGGGGNGRMGSGDTMGRGPPSRGMRGSGMPIGMPRGRGSGPGSFSRGEGGRGGGLNRGTYNRR
ncbi:ras GTPase-activating protein-binding protein 2 [Ischnura elegans]|uniref:ras GTPase-activating protein-binding protein 2 n=1 Tax=Ischnura elegans TaxID=197161 RepID=UPI001ED8A27A|nr:ras GTPase-activating protein-binding protein 2 [Ischnura elegans]XP_046393418.1 ras GTPase-activating protein-binding protein 2 [Ischnura elegans]XP_046393419.1 ras GTPase-activating protein-binding protein 2 [Ischnura elegans]XP_046393420.1 ras GTPase-activating protein-binding protein 2 [Ischnura elegans]